ncbi:hypothetical protein Elgi_38100 [Paenibacillus elgii]|uniref:hypothetical protein n=1 Tax=Paenibacillus elgii TaxID=189691 RepID=UPI002D7A5293|nr:hypothetical protein Elgi_38100 [Paenibacillus elgii]
MTDFKIFEVGNCDCEYIVSETRNEALEDHLGRLGKWKEWYSSKEEVFVREVSFEEKGRFETEMDGYQNMTFKQFLGDDFVYNGPQLICWTE